MSYRLSIDKSALNAEQYTKALRDLFQLDMKKFNRQFVRKADAERNLKHFDKKVWFPITIKEV